MQPIFYGLCSLVYFPFFQQFFQHAQAFHHFTCVTIAKQSSSILHTSLRCGHQYGRLELSGRTSIQTSVNLACPSLNGSIRRFIFTLYDNICSCSTTRRYGCSQEYTAYGSSHCRVLRIILRRLRRRCKGFMDVTLSRWISRFQSSCRKRRGFIRSPHHQRQAYQHTCKGK